MPKKIVGSVYWIENGRQTARVVDVQEAFSDLDQAKAQILYAERSGDKRQLRLARLAYRQFLGKRYRGENIVVPRTTTEVDEEKISKPSRKQPSRAKPSKRAVESKVTRNVPKRPSKSSRSEPSSAKPSEEPVRRRVARKAAKVASKSSRNKPLKAKSSKRAGARKVGRKGSVRKAVGRRTSAATSKRK